MYILLGHTVFTKNVFICSKNYIPCFANFFYYCDLFLWIEEMNSPSQHVEERFLMHQIYDETRFVLYFLRYFYLPYSTMQYKNSICQNFCKRPKHFLLSERRSIESALQKTTNKILWGCWQAFLIYIIHPFPEELLAKKFEKWHFFGITYA